MTIGLQDSRLNAFKGARAYSDDLTFFINFGFSNATLILKKHQSKLFVSAC